MAEERVTEELLMQGTGSLMGLCPEPERWRMLRLCEPFHVLPSQLSAEDLDWLVDYQDMKWLTDSFHRLHEVAAGEGRMPQDVAQRIIELCSKAEEKWQTNG